MTKQTEALKLALEALESIDVDYRSPGGWAVEVSFDEPKCNSAITAIREALAEESSGTEQPQQENQMPKPTRDIPPEPKNLFAKTPSQPAQPQQEPVAHQYREMNDDGTWSGWVGCDKPLSATGWRQVRDLYTSPPAQRKPLTKTKVGNFLRRHAHGEVGMYRNGLKDGVAFAEAAHGIKENT